MKYFRVSISGDDVGIPTANVIAKTLQELVGPGSEAKGYKVEVNDLFTRSRVEKNTGTRFDIEGPWATRSADGLVVPISIYHPGGIPQEIGAATISVNGGMTFKLSLVPEHKDVKQAGFEVPMRFVITKPE